MKTVAFALAAAAFALAAPANFASAESALVESRAKLEAAFAQDDVATRTIRTDRQVTSAATPSLFGSIFGAEVGFGAADPARVETGGLGGRFNVNR